MSHFLVTRQYVSCFSESHVDRSVTSCLHTCRVAGLFEVEEKQKNELTFLSLKPSIIELVLRALTNETEPTNTEMLLGRAETVNLVFERDCASKSFLFFKTVIFQCYGIITFQERCCCAFRTWRWVRVGRRKRRQLRLLPATARPVSSVAPVQVFMSFVIKMFSLLFRFDSETARGLFVHSSSLVCNRLMATWKLDLNIALAAMEVLSGLARVSLQTAHPLMCKRTVNWICKFQCHFLLHF